ncbi:MAG: putative mannose-6-phosphate isomerase, class [Bacteroidetes bacterium]|nr:putative mannose-6-phosphate isomerase, class [Bacteroidota bacterium]
MKNSNFNRFPSVKPSKNYPVFVNWVPICQKIESEILLLNQKKRIIAVEFYQGVLVEELIHQIATNIKHSLIINTYQLIWNPSKIEALVYPDVTSDRIFGYMTRLTIQDFFDPEKVFQAQQSLNQISEGTILILGPGAASISENRSLLIYADMARWEIQMRMRTHEIDSLGLHNRSVEDWMLLYKQGFFVDWRVLDKWKKKLFPEIDYFLDTNDRYRPKMVSADAVFDALSHTAKQPFSVVPFFDPAPWGGQWMKNNCNLDPDPSNYGWCFNCVPEENSLFIQLEEERIEIPSINLVFLHPVELLGDKVHARFGDQFPIRFDYLDTVDGGNLSLQVHPLTEYIQEKFGIPYTQDESYYIFYAKENAKVFLGLKEAINPDEMLHDLYQAQQSDFHFETEKYVPAWPVKTHDHLLIPAGTVHCSGKDCMVLEISATPYIFTFKMWDWGRLGLDGKPRPININHAAQVIQWDRVESWTKNNLINRIETLQTGDGWVEEKTGLHEREFIETRRFWFAKPVTVDMTDSVYVGCVIEGEEISIESPSHDFEPFVVHYAETFIIPAQVKHFTMKPSHHLTQNPCAVILAFVR